MKGKSCAALPPHSAMGAGASGCVDAVVASCRMHSFPQFLYDAMPRRVDAQSL